MANKKKLQEEVHDLTNCTSQKDYKCISGQPQPTNFFTERTDSYPETYSGGLSNIKQILKEDIINENSQLRGHANFDQGDINFTIKGKFYFGKNYKKR